MITLSVGVPYGSWGRVRHHLRTDNASSICSQSGSCPMTNPCLLAYQSKGHILHRLLEDFCDFCQVPFSPSLSWPLHLSLRVFFFFPCGCPKSRILAWILSCESVFSGGMGMLSYYVVLA